MFCSVFKSSDCHIIYSTHIPRKYLVWEVWEAFNFPAGSGDGTAWQGAWEKWVDTKTQVCSSELHRNPHTDAQIGLRSQNPGIFVLLWGGRKRNFLLSKGGSINTLWLPFGQSINFPHFPPQNPAGVKWKQSCLMIAWFVPCQKQHFYSTQVLSERFSCSGILVCPIPWHPWRYFWGLMGLMGSPLSPPSSWSLSSMEIFPPCVLPKANSPFSLFPLFFCNFQTWFYSSQSCFTFLILIKSSISSEQFYWTHKHKCPFKWLEV